MEEDFNKLKMFEVLNINPAMQVQRIPKGYISIVYSGDSRSISSVFIEYVFNDELVY